MDQFAEGLQQAPHAGEQLDLPAAADAGAGVLRRLPDVQRRVPRLQGQRRQGDLPAHLPVRGVAPAGEEVREAGRQAHGAAHRRGRGPELATITRLYELAYRCNLCRRCAQVCPIGIDNGLIAHELRKLFSQELGWAPRELHEKGTVLQLEVGSSTGMNQVVVKDNVEFIDEDMTEETGIEVTTPVGQGGRGRPAHPQRRRDPVLAGEPGGVRHHPERRGHRLDAGLRGHRVRRRQLRPLLRRRPARAHRPEARRRPRRS